jgi:hypothetical protein
MARAPGVHGPCCYREPHDSECLPTEAIAGLAMTSALPPLRAHDSDLLWVDAGVAFTRDAAGWTFTWSTPDVNCVWSDSEVMTTEELVEEGPPVKMTADALDSLARSLGREPSSLSWCRDRRLLERIVADDPEGVLVQLAAMPADQRPPATVGPTLVSASNDRPQPILTIALGAAAWAVAGTLVLRGESLEAPRGTVLHAASYAIEALDDSAGATAVLRHLIARGDLVPSAALLCHVRAPRIVHALIDAGAHPDALAPPDGLGSSPLHPAQLYPTPLANAVVLQRFDVAAALLERGASLEARDAQGRTALIVAVQGGNEAPVQWLLDHGAAVECAADVHGRTPRSLALARRDDPGSRLLLAALAASPFLR